MAISPNQLVRLLDRLIERTSTGAVGWERSLAGTNYQARFDDFIITIENNGMGLLGGMKFAVKKLSGSEIVSTGSGVLISTGQQISASSQILDKVNHLYNLIDSSSDEFEELIKMI